MPFAIEHRFCWLIQQIGEEDGEYHDVEYITTIAQDIGNTLSWYSWFEFRIMLVGVHKAGCGMWLSFVDLPTLQQLPDVTDAMGISAPWHRPKTGEDSFAVPNGLAIMDLAAQGFRKALKNEAGTTPTLHALACMYAQALEPENSKVKLCLDWTMQSLFARHWAETQLEGKMAMLVEKGICDMGIAAKGNARAIVGLKYDDDELPILEAELKMCNANEVKSLAGGCVSYGPRVWCANDSIVDACDKKQYPWLVLDAQPASDRSIWCDAMVIGSKTLKRQAKTKTLLTGGKKIPIVQPNPDYLRYGHQRYDKKLQKKVPIQRFKSTKPIIKCGRTKKVFKRDSIGKWQLATRKDTAILYVRDLKAVCLNPAVKGAVFIPGGDAKAVIKAVRAVAKVDGVEPTTLRAANLRCAIETTKPWVKSVFLAQKLLGDILKLGDLFTDYKYHTAFEVDGQIVEATVATLGLRENGQLGFVFNSELQKKTQHQPAKYQPLPYYTSACLFACRSFTEAELKSLDIVLSSARLAQLGGYPIDVAYVLPTDPGSYDDGMGLLQSGVHPNLADFRAMLKHGRFPRKERSAIDELLMNSFCFKDDVPERAKALGRIYASWRDAKANSMPGVPMNPKPDEWTAQNRKPKVVCEPDDPTLDNGWALAKIREKVQIPG